jgi:hypothetical protein
MLSQTFEKSLGSKVKLGHLQVSTLREKKNAVFRNQLPATN